MAEGLQSKEDPDTEGLQSKEAYCCSTVEGYVSVSGVLMVLVNNDMQ